MLIQKLKDLKASKHQRLPDINQLKIDRIPTSEDGGFKNFLFDSVPLHLNKLTIDLDWTHFKKNFGYYKQAFDEVLPRVKDYLILAWFVIQKQEFEQIVKKCKKVNTLRLHACTMEFNDKLDFGQDIDYQ